MTELGSSRVVTSLAYRLCGNCAYPNGVFKYCPQCGRNLDRERGKALAKMTEVVHETSLRKNVCELLYFHYTFQEYRARDLLAKSIQQRAEFMESIGVEDEEILSDLDRFGRQRLSFKEYSEGLEYLYKKGKPMEILPYLFQVYDTNSDSKLDRDELLLLLKSNMDLASLLRAGEDVSRANSRLYTWVKKHFDRADTDHDGLLDYPEVCGLMQFNCNGAPMISHIRLHLPVVLKQLREADIYEVGRDVMKDNVRSEKLVTTFVKLDR